jgi:tol-pal system protein YbgF
VYSQAFSALKAGSYSVAITGFKDFLASYAGSPLAENAQYWLGEAYYVTRSYDDAGAAFRTVLQKYPQSRKAPDAALKLGYTQYELKRYADARKTLQDVTQKYPDSDASRLATERLKRIPVNAPKG